MRPIAIFRSMRSSGSTSSTSPLSLSAVPSQHAELSFQFRIALRSLRDRRCDRKCLAGLCVACSISCSSVCDSKSAACDPEISLLLVVSATLRPRSRRLPRRRCQSKLSLFSLRALLQPAVSAEIGKRGCWVAARTLRGAERVETARPFTPPAGHNTTRDPTASPQQRHRHSHHPPQISAMSIRICLRFRPSRAPQSCAPVRSARPSAQRAPARIARVCLVACTLLLGPRRCWCSRPEAC